MKEPETGKKENTGKSGYSITTWRLHLWCRHPEWLRTTQEFYNRIAEFYYNLLLDHTDLWEMGSQQTLRELEIMSIPGRGGRIPSDPLPWQKVPLYFRRAAANEGIASAKSYLSRFAQDEKIGRAEKLNAAVTYYKGMYQDFWEAANPMLVRTYSGTKNVAAMADVYERTINIAWHALSLWWFDELDGRGPNTLYDNLKEHIETMRLVAAMGKPVETNVPHHFAFRGCDDVTYIVTGILAARMAKKCGVKNFVLQNMLNTPRSTWGVQDLAKSRAMLHIAKELEDDNFRIILQSRAGLDYFKPDLEAAKIQLASVTAMMDDIDPDNDHSPDIIHVVSYCEALYLATPDIINDSIKITRTALKEYRRLKKLGLTPDVKTDDIAERTEILETSARKILAAMEETIPDLYSPEGLYIAFVAGWLPVPELWSDSDEFIHAKCWETKMQNGGTHLVDHELLVPLETRINKCIAHNADAEYILKSKYKVLTRV